MSLLSKIKDAAVSKAQEVAGDAVSQAAGGLGGFAGSVSKSYSSGFDIAIKINDTEIKLKNSIITGVRVDSGMPPEAGVCDINVEIPGYKFVKNDELTIDGDFAQIKVGQSLVVDVANQFLSNKPTKFSTVFTGFVERIECEINNLGNVQFVLHGMDAKMWMMGNKLTEERGKGSQQAQIVKSVLSNYRTTEIGNVLLLDNVKFEDTFYQENESDYEFLCKMADLTGSLFYVDSHGKSNFCAPSKLGSPKHTVALKDDVVKGVRFAASVWGTPQSVKVIAVDPKDHSKPISGICGSVSSIGSGKASKQVVPQNFSDQRKGVRYVYITDNSVVSVDQAKARAEAEYNRRNLKFVETELITTGNPQLGVGQGVTLKGFGAPFDNDYIIFRIEHLWGTFSDDKMYVTKLYLGANKFTPQRRI